jgi:hypothetical protein
MSIRSSEEVVRQPEGSGALEPSKLCALFTGPESFRAPCSIVMVKQMIDNRMAEGC